jgi:integrase
MAKRRNNHEGTIFQLPSGRWRVQVAINSRRQGYTANTRQECSSWVRNTFIKAQNQGISPVSKITYGEYLENWLIAIESSIKETTFTHYEQLLRKHILPALGGIRIHELDPVRIQALYNEKIKAGYGARTVQVMHVVIHHSLAQAIKLGILDNNPDDATTPPKTKHREMRFYDEAQVSQFLIAAEGCRNEALYYIALYTGMRQAEILGLCWSDVDWKKKSIHVQRQLRRGFRDGELFTSPKSKAGIRTVLLGQNGLAQLEAHWQRQYQERVIAGNRWQGHDLIFSSSIGSPLDHSNLNKDFKRIINLAGLPDIRFHDLRHSSASLMLNHGIPPIIASRRLGHSRVSITLDTYGHLITDLQNEAAELLDELVTPASLKLHTTAHEPENVKSS